MSQVSDLIKDSKLHTKFESELITHTFLESTTIAGRRGRRRERNEVWKRKRHLGIGIFGTVWLEECVSEGKLRAVKEVRKSVPSLESIDFNRELEAIARFSQQKVSSL
jgi:serine/threonine protein kinase